MTGNFYNNEIIFTIIVAGIVLVLLVAFIVVFILFYQKRRSEYITEIASVKARFDQALLHAKLEIKEQTLIHIGYELHDNLGQIASLIKINLHTLQADDPVKFHRKLEDTKDLMRQLISDIKSLSLSLNSDRLVQMGISKMLENEITRLNKTGQFEALLISDGLVPEIDDNTTIILYRMVQEILNNSMKHSNSKKITITQHVTKKLYTLVCTDEGVGFNPDEKINMQGSGFVNLQNRAKLIKALLSIQSSPQRGTSITVELPL